MKLVVLFIFFPFSLLASTGYEITINEKGYDLKIEWSLEGSYSLQQVRHAIMKSEIQSALSPNIKSITNVGPSTGYTSEMVVKSMGIKSELVSKCHEKLELLKWTRDCSLQTDQEDR